MQAQEVERGEEEASQDTTATNNQTEDDLGYNPNAWKYVVEKYGADRVAQICTFGTLKAKQVLKDVGRVELGPGEIEQAITSFTKSGKGGIQISWYPSEAKKLEFIYGLVTAVYLLLKLTNKRNHKVFNLHNLRSNR
jgi:hypothetical protein